MAQQQRQLKEQFTTPQKAANPLFTGQSITTSEKIAPAMMAFQSPRGNSRVFADRCDALGAFLRHSSLKPRIRPKTEN